MKMIQLTTAGLLLCASLSATTQAQSSWPQNARRPSPVRQTGFEYSANDYVVIGDEATKPGASPSDQNAPPVAPAAGPAAEPAYAYEATEEEFRLFRLPQMECRRIEMRGWLDQGYTWNPDNPANRFNGPMTFNDRANEYQLNQLYLITERRTNTECRDFDWGGRVDFLYGTDYRFTRSRGLEENWEINDDHRFYGLAMPQLYADLAWRDWVFRFGHFYTMLGYEVVTAPDNFFYSHTYTHQYGEPFTHTGFLAKRKLNDRLSVSAGFQRGWDQWEDLNDKLGFLGNVSWTSLDERTGVSLGISTSNEQPVGDNVRTIFSGVFSRKLSEKMKYVAQFDYGFEDNALDFGNGLAEDAQWYGLVNYLFYELNDRWSVGVATSGSVTKTDSESSEPAMDFRVSCLCPAPCSRRRESRPTGTSWRWV